MGIPLIERHGYFASQSHLNLPLSPLFVRCIWAMSRFVSSSRSLRRDVAAVARPPGLPITAAAGVTATAEGTRASATVVTVVTVEAAEAVEAVEAAEAVGADPGGIMTEKELEEDMSEYLVQFLSQA